MVVLHVLSAVKSLNRQTNLRMPNTKLDMPKHKQKTQKSLKKCLQQTSKEYASVTTAHGLSYISNEKNSTGDRFLWILIVIIAILFTVFQMATLYTQWQSDPVITTLDTVALPIEEIEFPAITICPQGTLEEVVDSALFQQLKEYISNTTSLGHIKKKRSVPAAKDTLVEGLDYSQMIILAKEFLNEVYQ